MGSGTRNGMLMGPGFGAGYWRGDGTRTENVWQTGSVGRAGFQTGDRARTRAGNLQRPGL